MPRLPPLPGNPPARLARANAERGAEIGPWTAIARGARGRIDLDYTLYALLNSGTH